MTLTTFIDFVSSPGTTRLSKLREAKDMYAEEYAPYRDYYKALREEIERLLPEEGSGINLSPFLAGLPDGKKLDNYRACADGLMKWKRRKTLETFAGPPSPRWTSGTLSVAVNPELWVKVNGTPHAIKLYFKSDALSQQKANLILHVINQGAGSHGTGGVLDLRRGKLFTLTRAIPGLDALLDAEATAFATLWNAV